MADDKAGFSAYTGADYDRLQPLRIEHYHFYHELALDFVSFEENQSFRMLDLGPGTSTFQECVLRKYPRCTTRAIEYAQGMIDYSLKRLAPYHDRIDFTQGDLNEGLPADIGTFDLASSFSAIHHLTADNKRRLYGQICDALEPGGWFLLVDAMTAPFDDTVFALGRARQARRLKERFEAAGLDLEKGLEIAGRSKDLPEDAPDRDRLSRLEDQVNWLEDAGFRSVDHIWHYWMEHFIVCRK